tara:strand:+ start:439 stop:1167 length:729 start_codon:yes stop_codon:yes gene_type:complete
MKKALLISGHLRTFKSCFPLLKENLLDVVELDVFIHTWDQLESTTKSWHNQHMTNKHVTEDLACLIRDLYRPKKMKIQPQIDFGKDGTLADANMSLNGLRNMTYGFQSVYELLKEYEQENKKKYDRLMKIRPDILLKHKFSEDFFNIQDNSILFFGNKSPVPTRPVPRKFYHNFRALDIMSICSNDSASEGVYGLYANFDKYYKKSTFNHSPYLDLVLDKNINFDISRDYMYNTHWEILRGS